VLSGVLQVSASSKVDVELTFTYSSPSSIAPCGCSANISMTPPACDVCGVCGGMGECIGCDGKFMSGLMMDGCGQCGGDNSSCAGCDSVLFSNLTLDACGVCNGMNSSQDCNGQCEGLASLDACQVCAGGSTGNIPNANADCANVCFGLSVLDECGTCDSDPLNNCTADCGGVWGGNASVDCTSICSGGDTGVMPVVTDFCALCGGGNATLACDGVCGGPNTPNNCSQCPVDEGYGFGVIDSSNPCIEDCNGDWGIAVERAATDQCGTCFGGLTGVLENSSVACDGLCFGPSLVDHCGTCDSDPVNDCVADCGGVWAGNASLDCAIMCSGGSTGVTPAYIDHCGECTSSYSEACVLDCSGVWGGSAVIDGCQVCAGECDHQFKPQPTVCVLRCPAGVVSTTGGMF
jgi:hypothetical protein